MKKITTEEFFARAREIHGDKYDYSLVNYKNSNSKIIIICPNHGQFEKSPREFLNGRGCFLCFSKKLTNEQFIAKAREVHGDKYDYSLVNYKNSKSKVIIICNKHGQFSQNTNKHLRGDGCHLCNGGSILLTTEQFIDKAKETHGEKYDYSLVDYDGWDKKIIIICPKHGEFRQTACDHSRGCGCPSCFQEKRTKTTEQFIIEAKERHKDKYDYSKLTNQYTKQYVKITIICPKHGEFIQTAKDHLQGCGCVKCISSKGEDKIRDYLQNNNIKFEEQVRFKECKYKNKLSFDFKIYKNENCWFLLEYQGLQHYQPMRFNYTSNGVKKIFIQEDIEKNFQNLLIRDQIKRDFCLKNNIELHEIKYDRFDDIEIILDELINK